MSNKKYVYPQIPGKDFYLFRTIGSGLANCLFVYARAISYAHTTGAMLITPTWFNLSIGPYIRHQSDKRHYLGLFNNEQEISGLSKIWTLTTQKNDIHIEKGLNNYFKDILNDAEYIAEYIEKHVNKNVSDSIKNCDFSNAVAIHIRLGDYPEKVRIPLDWYKEKIQKKKTEGDFKFFLFSDGRDEELQDLLDIEGVERAFFGSAIADILAISKCCYVIGSDSTFSGWGAFLGQVPCIFLRKHYGPVLKDSSKEIVEDSTNLFLNENSIL